MLQFWRAIFFADIFDPLFKVVSDAIGLRPQVAKEYMTSGLVLFGAQWGALVAAIVAIIFVAKLLGFFNLGNLKKNGVVEKKESVLNGKNIIFLGSSVTKGMASQSRSFVDMGADIAGYSYIKEAVSGTTLVESGKKNYIARLRTIDKNAPCDIFVCQLSTNDATKKKPLGSISDSKDIASFDTQTVCGAIEYVIAYAKETWNDCPVVFYTNPQYASPAYAAMVDALYEIAKKWGVEVIDLWNDVELNKKECKKFSCMNDQIHPTKKGYANWAPVVVEALEAVAQGKSVPAREQVKPTAESVKKASTKKLIEKVLKGVLIFFLAFLMVVALCTFDQIARVTGLKSEGNNEKYHAVNQQLDPNSPVQGKKIFWLGSSVFASKNGQAEFADAILGTVSTKETKSGTLLANINYTVFGEGDMNDASDSYFPRLQLHDATTDPDIDLVCVQLSTNDSKGQSPTGAPLEGKWEIEDFDQTTTVGSLECITAYVRDTWGVPVVVISGTQFQDEMTLTGGQNAAIYQEMIAQCHALHEKWGDQFHIIDLWHNDPMYEGIEAGDDLWRSYMGDAIHPTAKGHLMWWGPYVREQLIGFLTK